ncbi:hypothetical protein [Mycolicibacterium setense]
MSDEFSRIEAEIADELALHMPEGDGGQDGATNLAIARSIVTALKAARIAVVELPDLDGIKLQHISFGPDAECEHECCPAWIEDDDTEVSYSLDEARDLAAALLAAADAAEVPA